MAKNKGGRPKIQLDQSVFEGMCRIQCTKQEICDVFDVDEKTLTRWCKDTYGEGFSEVRKKKSAVGLVSLRRNQFRAAEGGNTTMQIWLGKQYLGQTDKQEVKSEIESTNKFSMLTLEELKKLAE